MKRNKTDSQCKRYVQWLLELWRSNLISKYLCCCCREQLLKCFTTKTLETNFYKFIINCLTAMDRLILGTRGNGQCSVWKGRVNAIQFPILQQTTYNLTCLVVDPTKILMFDIIMNKINKNYFGNTTNFFDRKPMRRTSCTS